MLSFVFAQPPALRASPFHRKGVDGFLPLRPPSSERSWRVAPEVGSHCGLKKNVKYAFPRIVIPSAAEGSFSFPVSVFLRNAVCMKHRVPTSQRVRCFPLSVILASFPDRKRKRFLAFARNDDTGKAAFSYLPPSSGRRGPEEAEARSRYRLKKNVRYAFPRFVIPSPDEGSFFVSRFPFPS